MSAFPPESSASGFPRDNLHQNKLSRLLPDLNRLLLAHSFRTEYKPEGQQRVRYQPLVR